MPRALRVLVLGAFVCGLLSFPFAAGAGHTTDPAVNLAPLGHIEEPAVLGGFGGANPDINTDIAFWGQFAYQGNWDGFSIRNIRELRGVQVTGDVVTLGALATYTDLLSSDVIGREFPLVASAARETGAVAIQNRGTVAGNIANASPAADSPPALLAYDAQLELVSKRGSRRLPYDRFHTGYKKMDLAPDELIRAIHLPRRSGSRRHFYRKVGTRRAQAISKVCLAGVIEIEQGAIASARLALGSVAPIVVRARHAEAAITGKPLDGETVKAARTAVSSDISPIDDIRSTARYRSTVAGNLLEELLTSLS